MPNDCYNSITIEGDHEELKKFYEIYISKENGVEDHFDFNSVFPIPKEILKDENSWLTEWCIKNWGTKWNSYDNQINFDYERLNINFYTAWEPCIPVIEKLIEIHPEFKFEFYYEERGCDISGKVNGERGVITLQEHGDYQSDADEESWDEEDDDNE